MNIFEQFREMIREVVHACGALPAGIDSSVVGVEPPRDAAHGDLASNAAMALARQAGMKPRDIAEALKPGIAALAGVESVEIAGPGFINIRLDQGFWQARLQEILRRGQAFGDSEMGAGRAINVEYVSANPTGPLHVGHARGAVFGDALAGLLDKAGFDVTREYYINDAGNQIDALARSLHHRYREALGVDAGEMPEGLYPGDYLIEPARELAERDQDRWLDLPESEWLAPLRSFAVERMMALIRDDLAAIGIKQEIFTSELSLHRDGRIQDVVDELESRDQVYTGVLEPPKGKTPEDWEPRPQLLFRATDWGDDVDRPLRKSNGDWTYFAADIAYHLDKYRRGFADMIDVFGADHGGYVKRMVAATRAVTNDRGRLTIKLCQLVHLYENGEPAKMSKRAGTFITLRDVVDRVGRDAVRFMLLTRKNEAPLDFDFAKVMEQSRDNPVFYVQYAHARCCSVFRNAEQEIAGLDLSREALIAADLAPLTHPEELALIRLMAAWPRTIEQAAEASEPHRLAFYLHDLASAFHGYWTKGRDADELRFIQPGDPALTLARLAMVEGVRTVLRSGLGVLGVTPVEEMR
ncbi:arginine--tRNA ligase [Minwuia thermotolerans]|uniref:Arginine--tRNA ligase n=1 Tax=Minwuia thermotolerans TaxID=2056226 RepID=A0A2M9G2Y7_9PROT|nr:arginine--tRNA ligase [Minwuia thermotolerans]PJK30068.1 arginine--tRNA ligase [Minwuia thermotolerans]